MKNGFLINGKKEIKPKQQEVVLATTVARFMIDDDANYLYYSRAGGFVPPAFCLDSILTNPIHYGAGLFEGMRFYYSPYGVVLAEPWENIARMMHSATFFNPILAVELKKIFEKEGDVEEVRLDAITPRAFYETARLAYEQGKNPSITITVVKNANGQKTEEKRSVELSLTAMLGWELKKYTMAEMDALIKALGFVNRLVSVDYFPQGLEMVPSGYIRPFAWVSGEMGLKVPTILKKPEGFETKPLYFAIATLPWGVYLNENDYNKGLDVLVGPYPRLGLDMPSDAKIAGNYVNSALNINLGSMFGYGEILALDNNGKVIEGSAENLFVLRAVGNDVCVFTPPTGSGCLPGTTRDRIIRVLEKMGAKVIYEALPLGELYRADGVLLSGTGAQMIHIRSINHLKAAEKMAEMMHLQSENKKGALSIRKEDFVEDRKWINKGERHALIDRVRQGYAELLTGSPDLLVPVHDINFEALASVLDTPKTEIMTKDDIADEKAGYFKQKVNGLTQPNELAERLRRVSAIISKAIEKTRMYDKDEKARLKKHA